MDRVDQTVKLRKKITTLQQANQAIQAELVQLSKDYAQLNVLHCLVNTSYEHYSRVFEFEPYPFMVSKASFYKKMAENGNLDSPFCQQFLKYLEEGNVIKIIEDNLETDQKN